MIILEISFSWVENRSLTDLFSEKNRKVLFYLFIVEENTLLVLLQVEPVWSIYQQKHIVRWSDWKVQNRYRWLMNNFRILQQSKHRSLVNIMDQIYLFLPQLFMLIDGVCPILLKFYVNLVDVSTCKFDVSNTRWKCNVDCQRWSTAKSSVLFDSISYWNGQWRLSCWTMCLW